MVHEKVYGVSDGCCITSFGSGLGPRACANEFANELVLFAPLGLTIAWLGVSPKSTAVCTSTIPGDNGLLLVPDASVLNPAQRDESPQFPCNSNSLDDPEGLPGLFQPRYGARSVGAGLSKSGGIGKSLVSIFVLSPTPRAKQLC